jgi:hypothetical protein
MRNAVKEVRGDNDDRNRNRSAYAVRNLVNNRSNRAAHNDPFLTRRSRGSGGGRMKKTFVLVLFYRKEDPNSISVVSTTGENESIHFPRNAAYFRLDTVSLKRFAPEGKIFSKAVTYCQIIGYIPFMHE